MQKNKIVSVLSKKKDQPDLEVANEVSDLPEDLLQASEAILRAIEAKSPHDLASALKSLLSEDPNE